MCGTCLLYTSYVPVMKDCALESRYLGLKLPKERKDTEDKLTRLGEQILKSVDIAGLLELAENAPELQEKKTQGYTSEMVENLAENAQYSTESVRTKDTVPVSYTHLVYSVELLFNALSG